MTLGVKYNIQMLFDYNVCYQIVGSTEFISISLCSIFSIEVKVKANTFEDDGFDRALRRATS